MKGKSRTALPLAAFLFLAVAPLLILLRGHGLGSTYLFTVVNALGWGVALLLYGARDNTLHLIRRKLEAAESNEDVEALVHRALDDIRRYARAAFALQLEESIRSSEINQNLGRILKLALSEFDARSAELALVDKETKLCSQALLLGVPSSSESQSMLASEQVQGPVYCDENGCAVLIQPVRFSGETFGLLRIELRDRAVSASDLNVLRLLAVQSAVVLIDARFTDELLRMRRLGEESVQAKTGFLANLSHEIRGPLGIILNGVELAQDGLCGEVSASMKETLAMIRDSGAHLLDLVNDVLDYAKVEAGKVVARPVQIAVRSLLEDLVSVVRSQAVAKKHDLTLERIDATLGVLCDKRHARQMLINLLTNAIKYTPEGGKISVKAERYVGGRVKITVCDTGIGIPASQRGKVFGAFERVDNKYAQNQMGTGLGMPLTLKLAQTNNGTVDFQSEEGEGSTFWLILPASEMKDVPAEESATHSASAKVRYGRGESVLLVDPDVEYRQLLERYLGDQGFTVLSATNGREVMQILREKLVDVAVLENDLPDLSGEEMVAAIRASPRASALPLVLLSSKAFVFDIERFLRLGVDRCLAKPVKLDELAYTTRRLIDETKVMPQ